MTNGRWLAEVGCQVRGCPPLHVYCIPLLQPGTFPAPNFRPPFFEDPGFARFWTMQHSQFHDSMTVSGWFQYCWKKRKEGKKNYPPRVVRVRESYRKTVFHGDKSIEAWNELTVIAQRRRMAIYDCIHLGVVV